MNDINSDQRVIYFDKKFLEFNEIKISPINPSTYYGLNIFEGVRGYFKSSDNKFYIFSLDSHINRLRKSANKIGFNFDFSSVDINEIIFKIINLNNYKEDVYIRISLLNINNNESWNSLSSPSLLIDIKKYQSKRSTVQSINYSLIISKTKRIHYSIMSPKIKCGANYINSRYAYLEALKNNYSNALMLDINNYISESTGSAIFFFKNNIFYTPNLTSSILDSITRKRIIQILKILNFKVIEKKIKKQDLKYFSGAFLAGTMIEIQFIHKINNFYFKENKNFYLLRKYFFENAIFNKKWSSLM